MKPRAAQLPKVSYSDKPESVIVKILVDEEDYEYLRITLTPMEALRLGNDLVNDALRAVQFKKSAKN